MKVSTFSTVFPGTSFNEYDYIRTNIKSLGVSDPYIFEMEVDDDFIDTIENINDLTHQPFADSSILVTSRLAKYVSQHSKAYIGADGADELFWGYQKYQNLRKYVPLYKNIPEPLLRLYFNTKSNNVLDHIDFNRDFDDIRSCKNISFSKRIYPPLNNELRSIYIFAIRYTI